jgi:AcrR family transcriptional regulator
VTDETIKVDRRVRRNAAALQRALVELALENGYSATTIEHITTRADVARATFYAHYADKQALLTSIATDLTRELTTKFAPLAPSSTVTRGAVALAMYRHAAENRDVYRLVLSGAGDPPASQTLIESLAASTEAVFTRRAQKTGVQPRLPVPFLARMWLGQNLALLAWWLLGELPYSAEQVALMRIRYHVYGAEWAYGYQPGQWQFDESLYGADAEVAVPPVPPPAESPADVPEAPDID